MKYLLLTFSIVPIVAIIQALLNRLFTRKGPQFLAMVSVIIGYLPFLLLFHMLLSDQISALSYEYVLLLYFFFAYTYFHFFNMSETSRRIRMLFAMEQGKNIDEISIYNDDEMIRARVKRLIDLGQIREVDGHLHPRGILFRSVGYILYYLSCFLGRPWLAVRRHERLTQLPATEQRFEPSN
ncbi:MAG: hypothetical protein HY537_18490 [Deltaproteobacteria bacterium]|nr:hypothetical protein [Deltaproteobacteria bacterium]